MNSLITKFVFFIVVSFLFLDKPMANDYIHTATVSTGLEVDSNPRMLNDKQSVLHTRINPKYSIRNTDDDEERYVNLAFLLQRSSDESASINRNDPSIQVGWDKLYALGKFTSNFRISKLATRTSEIEETGDLVGDASRVDRIFNVGWTQFVTERLSANIGAGYSNVDFIGNTALNGFVAKRLNSSLTYEWLPNFQTYAVLNFTKQEQNARDTNVLNPMLGFNWSVSENFTTGASAGVNRSSGDASGTGTAFSSNARYVTNNTISTIDISRSLFPSGANGFIESDRIKANLSYNINDNYHSQFSYINNKNKTLNSNETQIFKISLVRNLNRLWNSNIYYLHRDLQNDFRSASADVFGVSITYNHPDF